MKLWTAFFELCKNDDGVTAIEYALIASLIFVVIVAAVADLGTSLVKLYKSVVSSFP